MTGYLTAIGLFASVYLVLIYFVSRLRPIPLYGAVCIAFSCFIGLETVLLNGLSLFSLVTREGIIFFHLFFLVVSLWPICRKYDLFVEFLKRIVRKGKKVIFTPGQFTCLLVPLFIILFLTAFLYSPNTWDSMTYHMGRIVQWMQQASIEYFVTNNRRQNEMGPGAEYLILFFQLVSRTDYLANSVQFFSYILLVPAQLYLLRVFRVPQKMGLYVLVISMTAPMAVMQASSTQNDLVDAIVTLSILIACVRLVAGRLDRLRRGDYILMGITLASGFLVKPIAIVVAAPLIGLGILFQFGRLVRSGKIIMNCCKGIGLLVMTFIIIAGPDIGRKAQNQVFSRSEVYPIFSEWNIVRMVNPLSITLQNMPFPKQSTVFLKEHHYPAPIFTQGVFNAHEDFVGNPIQLIVLLLATALSILIFLFSLRKGRRYSHLFLLSLYPLLAWCAFGLIVRNQVWITRLQLPLFFLLPFSFIYIGHFAKTFRPIYRGGYGVLFFISLFSVAYGVKAASVNPSRPLDLRFFWGERPSSFESYYRTTDKRKIHNFSLQTALKEKCDKIAMLLVPDTFEYPLTWRGWQLGLSYYHAFPDTLDGQACMLFADDVKLKYVPNRGTQWLSAGDGHTYLRNLKYDFEHSDTVCLALDQHDNFYGLQPLHDMKILKKNNELILHSTGNDPYLLLPHVKCKDQTVMVLRIDLESPHDTDIQLFYKTVGQNGYSEENSFSKKILAGRDEVYFQLPISEIYGLIRLDPGRVSGNYIVHGIEGRKIMKGSGRLSLHAVDQ